MDLAGTPTISQHAQPLARFSGASSEVRLLSAKDAADPAFCAAWNDLVSEASEPNPFFEPWFLLPSLEQFACGSKCDVFTLLEGDRLVGLLPTARRQSYYGYPIPHVAGWLHDNAFCGVPLVARGYERAFWRAFLAHFDETPGMSLFLHLPELPADGPLNHALIAELVETGRPSASVEAGERAMLASSAGPADYLARAMSAKKRKELRRQRNRLAEQGELSFSRLDDRNGLDDWINEFLALEAAGWKGDAGSALVRAPATRAFFADALRGAAEKGRLERLDLRLDGEPIAMLANFLTAPGAYSFKTAFDERFARFSPGLLLQIENLDLLNRDDIAWTDSCAVEGHPMIERIWREKRRIVTRNIAIGGALRQAAFRALMAYENRKRSQA